MFIETQCFILGNIFVFIKFLNAISKNLNSSWPPSIPNDYGLRLFVINDILRQLQGWLVSYFLSGA